MTKCNCVSWAPPQTPALFDEIIDEISACGDINLAACERKSKEELIIHCWDGRRYQLHCFQLKSGYKYCPNCGELIKE